MSKFPQISAQLHLLILRIAPEAYGYPDTHNIKKKKGKQEGAHGEKALREGNRVTQLETLIFKGSACIFCYRLFVWWP